MDKITQNIKRDQQIMKLLKISELRHHVANSNLGPIDLQIRYGEDTYQFLLDATIVDKETNDRLLKLFELK